MIEVQLHALEVFGHHGVTEDERRRGQVFLYDVDLDVSDAALSDRIEDAVDYVAVAASVRQISDRTTFSLLEALAAAVADAILERFAVSRVRVRVRKRDVEPAGLAVAWTAATAERRR